MSSKCSQEDKLNGNGVEKKRTSLLATPLTGSFIHVIAPSDKPDDIRRNEARVPQLVVEKVKLPVRRFD